MMKKNIKYNLFGLFILLLAFTSCDTAEQDVSPIISPDGKPMVAISTESNGSVYEGGSITYTVSLDQTLDRAITFTPVVVGGTADDHDYEALEPVTIEPYTNSVDFTVMLIDDETSEAKETLVIQLEIQGIAEKYLVNPNAVIDPINFEILNLAKLGIKFSWNNTNDYDMVTWNATGSAPTEWGDGGATLANPENDHSIWTSDPIGNYYVNIMEWGYGEDFNYTFILTLADDSTQTITGTFKGTDVSGYTNDSWTAWGGGYDSFRVLKVVNDGTKFTVTKL